MTYSIGELAKLAGVSTRTLRHYDEINLLKPSFLEENGYRVYSEREVQMLQQIMFYREFGLSLVEIDDIINASDFDQLQALELHYQRLQLEKNRINQLMQTVKQTIKVYKEDLVMSKEQFEGFKQQQIQENEAKYGEEIREKYGEETVNASNQKFSNMSQEDYKKIEQLSEKINELLLKAVPEGEPNSELGHEVAQAHKEWLLMVWPDGLFTEEAHIGLALMYTQDERFTKYYDNIIQGAADYLYQAITNYYTK